jgi:hypothetical protein
MAGGGGGEETTSAVTCSGFVVCESVFINQYNLTVQVKLLDEQIEQEKPLHWSHKVLRQKFYCLSWH